MMCIWSIFEQKVNNVFYLYSYFLLGLCCIMGRKLGGTKKMLVQLLLEYLKDSDRSDSKVAKELGVSQATVSRLKSKLLKEGYISHFSAIPDLSKMGYEILAFSIVKFNMDKVMENFPKIEKIAKSWAKNHPEILFDALAEGMGMDAINISVHKNYADYKAFLADNKRTWGDLLSEVHFILVDLNGPIAKHFSFKYLTSDDTQ
jgi:DNA-binding Lrp family transcriptional regulator